ncbi:cobalamin B12-binding domain-containing protein [Nocardiopsis quinghaiensis]|uniref:cobalamin B12-binding domain-containing protein n=1 Tax=Nocardiopsis quinghaiensis TaxID=464995 RepID=UPI001CC23DC0|nr:methylmalonyl-CoA mutase [Nocardiopsis quinghaiensis]
MQLLLEEMGHDVVNLGACVPEKLLAEECLRHEPDLLVVSSVNGHGFNDGLRIASHVRSVAGLEHLCMVIGGKLSVDGVRDVGFTRRLLNAGFDAVFGDDELPAFRSFVEVCGLRVSA